jgi:quercetin dioxygenase-like cupin family protein
MSIQISAHAPYSLAAGAGTPMVWFGSTITLKASNPGVGITEVVLRPGEEPPIHIHKNEDEWLYVLDGEVTFHVGGKDHFGKAGAFVSFPRGIPHTFSIESENGRILVINTPGGFEQMFELAPRTPEEAERAMNAFGMTVVGPHPRETRGGWTASSLAERGRLVKVDDRPQ